MTFIYSFLCAARGVGHSERGGSGPVVVGVTQQLRPPVGRAAAAHRVDAHSMPLQLQR